MLLLFAAESRWEKLQPSGDTPPCLQEHTAVAYRENIYVFGGELGFSAGSETPLWIYKVKVRCRGSGVRLGAPIWLTQVGIDYVFCLSVACSHVKLGRTKVLLRESAIKL